MERVPYSIAFVQDWLVDFGGAERCLEALCPEFPDAPIHTLFHDPAQFAGSYLENRSVHTTFLDHPFFRNRYRTFLPLYPLAVEQLDPGTPDVVLSFSHAVAKGVLTRAGTLHVCYCHTPVRYAWDLYHDYLRLAGLDHGLKSWLARLILHYIRLWDSATAHRVDVFIANSRHVARRIRKTYGREAEVIHPPVDVGRFAPAAKRGDHFLAAGRLVAYKRFDLAVATCTRLGLPLRVVGDGPELDRVKRIAGPTVAFLGRVSDGSMAEEMATARALLFCGEEDFGITPVEAQAAGTPVIAYGRGGALETVVPPAGEDFDGATGLFFQEASLESLAEALRLFDASCHRFRPEVAVAQATRFATDRYIREMMRFLEVKWGDFHASR